MMDSGEDVPLKSINFRIFPWMKSSHHARSVAGGEITIAFGSLWAFQFLGYSKLSGFS